MKTLSISFLLSFMLISAFSQIELEHSYAYSGSLAEIDDMELKYYIMDVPMEQCRIYNEDHSLFKTINLPVPEGFYLYDVKFISRRIFNNDDYIELLYIYNKIEVKNAQSVYTYGLKVINESGTKLLELNDGGFAELKEASDGTKLLTYQYIWNESYYLINTNVYSLAKEGSAASAAVVPELSLFPNPVSNELHLAFRTPVQAESGKILVHDMYGRVVLKNERQALSDITPLNIEALPPGTYLLSIVSDEGILLSEKFEKK